MCQLTSFRIWVALNSQARVSIRGLEGRIRGLENSLTASLATDRPVWDLSDCYLPFATEGLLPFIM